MDSVTIQQATPNPTLEQTAKDMGIDPATIDSSSESQSAPENAKLLGKFNSAEDLAKAYQELEKKLGQPKEDVLPSEANTDSEEEEDAQTEETSDSETTEVEKELEARGLDFNEFTNEYEEQGALSDTAYEKLEKAGIPKAMVDQFIAGQEAVREIARGQAFAETGGEEAFFTMTSWAAENYTPEEIQAFNDVVEGPDSNARLLAIRGLKARYETVNGREPVRTLTTTSTNRGNTSVYSSVAEMQKDMNDPRYNRDAAYTARVAAKLGRSNIL